MENIIFTLDNGNTIEQQTRDRTTYIGGSDVAAILGVSDYKSPLDIYNAKINGVVTEQNIAMRVGLHCEELIIDHYKESLPELDFGFYNVNAYSALCPFIGAQLDFLAVTSERQIFLADVKAKGQNMQSKFGEEYTDDMPLDIKCQVALQRYLTGAIYVDVPVLFFPAAYKVYRYTANEAFEDYIMDKIISFWHDHILPKNPPAPTTKRDLDLLFPISNGLTIEVDAKFLSMAEEAKKFRQRISELTDMKDAYDLEIKKIMGANEVATYGGEKIATCKTSFRKGYSVKETSFRPLRIA